jgi:hypothetical protein
LQDFENDISVDSNPQEIAKRTDIPILARIGYEATEILNSPDWFELARPSPATD